MQRGRKRQVSCGAAAGGLGAGARVREGERGKRGVFGARGAEFAFDEMEVSDKRLAEFLPGVLANGRAQRFGDAAFFAASEREMGREGALFGGKAEPGESGIDF